jgi:DNA-binding CsgD family transcriptional regulator
MGSDREDEIVHPQPMAFPRHSLAPSELARIVAAERAGEPFLAFRGGDGELRIEPLEGRDEVAIGRSDHHPLALHWDAEVSRTHARLECFGADWTVVDDGLSRNGSFVNGERLAGRRRLHDGDVLRVGRTTIAFRAPVAAGLSTAVATARPPDVTTAERRVLVALCRPLLDGDGSGAVPASNEAIAAELQLSLSGVKSHIRALFEKLGLDDLPRYGKRTELAQRAVALGLVTARDL